ncbi:MAG: anaerobic ribonucleoside-triphosphate reductase activating protein [Deltaproteobacteria bacterium]|jgi:pyruvate formate lyase activating enzyme
MPGIKALLETSFLDWQGRVCAVLFLGGCNFRCPFCHNHSLVLTPEEYETISIKTVERQLAPFRKWLGGICITGGEPTLHPGLPDMIRFLKSRGWAVKLDTNGSRPEALSELLSERLLDAVAMDVKAPLEAGKYACCAGVPVELDRIRESIRLLGESGIEHEFRMTVVPKYHTEEDIRAWAAALGGGPARLSLQNFNPRTTMDPDLGREKGFTPEVFEKLRTLVSRAGKS